MTITRNHKARHPQGRCGSSAGSSHSWRKRGPDHGASGKRFAWPQHYHIGKLYAKPTGQGGGTSTPSPKPAPVEKPGGGSSPKRA